MAVLAIEPEVRPAVVPPAWVKAAAAKLKRDRQSYADFRAADQQQHERAYEERMTRAVALAETDLREWQEDVAELEARAAEALAAFRAAEDRSREAAKFAAQKRLEYERIKGKGGVEEEYDAAVRADTADTVAADAAEVLEEKRAAMADADECRAADRERPAGAERALDAARKEAAAPAGDGACLRCDGPGVRGLRAGR